MEGVVHIGVTSIPETWSQKMPRIWKCGMAQQYISANSQCKRNVVMINWHVHTKKVKRTVGNVLSRIRTRACLRKKNGTETTI